MKYLLPIICPLLYGLGGADNISKGIRRFSLPIIMSLFLWSLYPLLLTIPFSFGYGESSFLYKFFKGKQWLIRGFVGVFIALILYLITWKLWALLFILWYLLWTVLLKIDDFEIDGLLVEECLIGFGVGIFSVL